MDFTYMYLINFAVYMFPSRKIQSSWMHSNLIKLKKCQLREPSSSFKLLKRIIIIGKIMKLIGYDFLIMAFPLKS